MKKGTYFLLPKDIARKLNLSVQVATKSENDVENVRYFINDVSDIDTLSGYIIYNYQQLCDEYKDIDEYDYNYYMDGKIII